MLARKLAGTPGFIERMGEKIVASHAYIKLGLEVLKVHGFSTWGCKCFASERSIKAAYAVIYSQASITVRVGPSTG
jgi:hypothetical protein